MNKKILLAIFLGVGCMPAVGSSLAPVAAQVARAVFLTKGTLVTVGAIGTIGAGSIFYNHLTNTIAPILPNTLQNIYTNIYTIQMSILKKTILVVVPVFVLGAIGTVEYHCYRMSKKRLRA